MPQFDNPYAEDTKARVIPGVVERHWANMIAFFLKFAHVSLRVEEVDGLALFLGGVLRAYPKLADQLKDVVEEIITATKTNTER